jgi:serine protease Do
MPTTLETLSHDLAGAVETAARSVVAVHARRRIPSTGILWREGLVVAANHTVQSDDEVPISHAGDAELRGRVVGRDPTTDLCLIRLAEGADLPPATTEAAPVRIGQLALIVARPGRDATASLGVVSAVGPAWRTARGGRVDRFVKLDVSIYDGFSGSPLVTAAGRVAGLCTSGLGRGAALVVPTPTVDRVVDALLASGGVTQRGFLGIGTQLVALPDAVRAQLAPIGGRVPRAGLMIVSVQPGTPADRAGLMLGDLLVGLGDDPIEDPRDVFAALGPDTVGQTLRATIVRAGRSTELSLTVDAHPGRS